MRRKGWWTILGVSAALGAGGLLWWLSRRNGQALLPGAGSPGALPGPSSGGRGSSQRTPTTSDAVMRELLARVEGLLARARATAAAAATLGQMATKVSVQGRARGVAVGADVATASLMETRTAIVQETLQPAVLRRQLDALEEQVTVHEAQLATLRAQRSAS